MADLIERSSPSRKVFVIGSGRTGTHLVGYILSAHPDIFATIEEPPIFEWVTRMAINPISRAQLFPRLIEAYNHLHRKAAPRHYVDKSHPNLWIAEALAIVFPSALFVGVERNVFATVASMLKHETVKGWHARWKRFPVPNEFLGITREIAPRYGGMPVAMQAALRWRAHTSRMKQARATLGHRLFVVEYESLQQQPDRIVADLTRFLQLRSPLAVPELKRESLDRWRSELDQTSINQIRAVIDAEPGESV